MIQANLLPSLVTHKGSKHFIFYFINNWYSCMFPLTFKSTVKPLLVLALICSVNIKDMPGAIYHTTYLEYGIYSNCHQIGT